MLAPWLTVGPWSTPPAPLVAEEALVDAASSSSGASSLLPVSDWRATMTSDGMSAPRMGRRARVPKLPEDRLPHPLFTVRQCFKDIRAWPS
ncbi:hypothetical protein [Sorangium sp. So ce128]|uniref:hypothetical protein n=1 Tax=Sorangium sp. So ce128 TaxID=3133281 RepID=UPI003F5EC853